MNRLLILPFMVLSLAACRVEQKNSAPEVNAPGPVALAASDIKHVDAQGAAGIIELEKPIILDVRTPEEFAEVSIEGAVNIDYNSKTFAQDVDKLDKSKLYLLHCRSGNRSGQSLALFKKLGFTTVYHLDGGIIAWEEAGLPVKK